MANVPVILSISILDADGEVAATPFYGHVADTATVANLVTGCKNFSLPVDTIVDGQIVKTRITIEAPLDSGLKASPVAGSEIERTGLFSWDVIGTIYDFATDLAAFALSKFTGNAINLTDSDVAVFIANMTGGVSPFIFTDKYQNALNDVETGRKTFRKHRKSTLRS